MENVALLFFFLKTYSLLQIGAHTRCFLNNHASLKNERLMFWILPWAHIWEGAVKKAGHLLESLFYIKNNGFVDRLIS